MRRRSIWSSALDIDWKPLIDIAYHVDKEKRADTSILDVTTFPNRIVKKTCELMLHWDLVKDSDAVKNLNLPDPFEPLIKFYERGGSIYYEAAGFVIDSAYGEIGFCRLDKSLYIDKPAFVELDDEILDRIDDGFNEETS